MKKKWMTAISALILTGVLATGVAFANSGGEKAANPSKPSPGVQELMGEIRGLREARMQQLRADVDALIDRAAAEGKITAEEGARLKARHHFKQGHHGHKGGQKSHRFDKEMTEEQLKAKLETAVKSGRVTQEQATQILQRWQAWKAQESKS